MNSMHQEVIPQTTIDDICRQVICALHGRIDDEFDGLQFLPRVVGVHLYQKGKRALYTPLVRERPGEI